MRALALESEAPIQRLEGHLHLGPQVVFQVLRQLEHAGLARTTTAGAWVLTDLGRRALEQGTFSRSVEERRTFYFVEGEGPKFHHPVRDAAAIAKLGVPDMETGLRYVMDAVRTIRRELGGKLPLIGFSGSPWTLACYMVEGGGSKDFARIKAMALNDPKALHALLAVNTDAVVAYLSAQRAAGAQALQVFDTWGGVLSPAMYREFSLRYLSRIAQALPRGEEKAPLILFGKGNGAYLEELADTGAEGVGVDWTVGLGDAARRTGGRVALQGNLDPVTLYAQPDAIRREVGRALDDYAQGNGGSREGHVFNLGHGMSPDMSPDHVAALVAAVHELSAR